MHKLYHLVRWLANTQMTIQKCPAQRIVINQLLNATIGLMFLTGKDGQ